MKKCTKINYCTEIEVNKMNEKAVSKKSKHSNDSEAINTKAI